MSLFSLAAAATAATPAEIDAATRAWIATLDAGQIARSNAYFEGGYWLQLAGWAVGVAISALFLFTGWGRGLRAFLERTVKWGPLVVIGFAAIFLIASSILSLPFSYMFEYLRDQSFGLSNQTPVEWLTDAGISIAVSTLIGAVFVGILYGIVHVTKRAWWLWGAGVTIAMMAVLIALSPVFITPLFNTYTPMADGPQKQQILQMAQANGVPADDVFVFDRSRQSDSITANVSGLFGTTRISLADTLLKRTSPDGVNMVMGHEIGHYVLNHIVSILAFNAMTLFALFALLNVSFNALTKNERFGIRGPSDVAGLPLVFALFSTFALLATPIFNGITRFHEHQADIYGINASRSPDGFAEAALMLSEYRKLEPSPLEKAIFYTHPSGWDRIHMAMQWKAHEMAAGRYPQGPLGPPPGFKPNVKPAGASPAAASD